MYPCSEKGILKSYSGMDKVRALKSYRGSELKIKPGMPLQVTVDYLSNPGWVMLVHEDPEVVKADAAFIHKLAEDKEMYELLE